MCQPADKCNNSYYLKALVCFLDVILTNYSLISINGPLSTTAADSHIHISHISFYFNLSTTATSPQGKRPLKRVPTAKITFRQRSINRLTNNAFKTAFFYCKRWQKLNHTARRWFLFQHRYILIVLRVYTLQYAFLKTKSVEPQKYNCHITSP